LFKDELGLSGIVDNRKETGKKIALPWVKKPHALRDYQDEAVSLMLQEPCGLINLATGLGKTLLTLHFIQRYKKRALIVCPSDSVAKQFYELFEASFGKNKVGFYGGGKKKISDITIGIAASVTKGIADFQNADLGVLIMDETHHTPATTFFDISQGLAKVGKRFGLTATDYRSDGKDIMITAGCGPVLIRRDIKWGVENKWLAEPYFFVRQVYTQGKDYKDDKIKSYKEHVLNNLAMCSQIEDDARRMMAAGKSVLILVDEVAHGKELSLKLGIPFATGIDSKSQEYVDQLNAGTIPGLVGTDGKIGEGSDTQNVDVLVLANFVASKGPVIQAVGRGLRKQGTKTKCIILDYIPMGSTMMSRHGFGRVDFYREITDKVKII
jgi:superfamily II DNA or RNA helicase